MKRIEVTVARGPGHPPIYREVFDIDEVFVVFREEGLQPGSGRPLAGVSRGTDEWDQLSLWVNNTVAYGEVGNAEPGEPEYFVDLEWGQLHVSWAEGDDDDEV